MKLKDILNKDKENPFHFYTIVGVNNLNENEVISFLKESLNFDVNQNLDFFRFKKDLIDIDTVRDIKNKNSVSRVNDNSYKVFFVSAERLNKESQNALLKVTEEPNEKTIIFLFLPNSNSLLDTVLSRTRLIEIDSVFDNVEAEEFLFLNFKNRDDFIKKLDKEKHLSFIESLDFYILKNKDKFLEKESQKDFFDKYKKFIELKQQAYFKGSNTNNILTFIALIFPKI